MWHVLRSLFGRSPPAPEFVRLPPPEFLQDSPPDWLVEWRGDILPGGASFHGRLPLWERNATALADVVYPFSRRRPTKAKPSPLGAAATERLLEILKRSFPEQLLAVPSHCYDGYPVELAVHRRELYLGVKASCNLGDAASDFWRPYRQGDEEKPFVSCIERIEQMVHAGNPPPATFQLAFLLFEVACISGTLAEGNACT